VSNYPDDAVQSKALFERAKQSLPGGNTRTTVFMKPFPIYATHGKGFRVWDADGVARIDCINNFTAGIHGHAHPVLIAAAEKQLALGSAFGLPTSSEIDLAELLCARVASVERVRFCNSGSEAVMMAIKAARAFTGRSVIAKVEGAYHGSYDYAEVSLDPSPKTWGSNRPNSVAYAQGTPASVLSEVLTLPFNDPAGASELIRSAGSTLAAVLIDPMPNRAGLVPASREYIDAVQEAARSVGALVLFDEVISLRLGYRGAQAIWNAEPDLTMFGKIIGGGFPVGAVAGRAEVMAVFDPTAGKPALPHGGTFSANPVTMRAGVAAMELLDEAEFARMDDLGERLREGLRGALADEGIPGCVTGAGSLLRFHLVDRVVSDYRSSYLSADEAELLSVIHKAFLDNGVLASNTGLMALSTPMNKETVAEILEAFTRSLRKTRA
jgi:glutamate-1-semialdehyde 2,1-aminomutase